MKTTSKYTLYLFVQISTTFTQLHNTKTVDKNCTTLHHYNTLRIHTTKKSMLLQTHTQLFWTKQTNFTTVQHMLQHCTKNCTYTTLHNSLQLFTIQQNNRKLCRTLDFFPKKTFIFTRPGKKKTKLYTTVNIVHNVTKLYNFRQSFKNLTKTYNNNVQYFKQLHKHKIFTHTLHNFTKTVRNIRFYTTLLQVYDSTQLNTILQNFTTIHNYMKTRQTLQNYQQLYNTQHTSSKLYTLSKPLQHFLKKKTSYTTSQLLQNSSQV